MRKNYYACVLWRSTKEKEAELKNLIKEFKEFEIIFENRAHLPKESAKKVFYRMYDWYVSRPWQQQIALLEDTDYYFAILRSDSVEDPEDWLLTRGGITLGNNSLLKLKEAYRANQADSWISLHTSINQAEARRDIFTHLGINIDLQADQLSGLSGPRQPPTPGIYENEEKFVEAVKAYPKCCLILESAEACLSGEKQHMWKSDLLLLVDDPKAAARFFGLESDTVSIGSVQRTVRLLGVHSSVLCPVWAKAILDTSERDDDGLPVPSAIHHFFTLLYFAEFWGDGISEIVESTLTKIAERKRIFSNQDLILFKREYLLLKLRAFILGSGFSIPSGVAKRSDDNSRSATESAGE